MFSRATKFLSVINRNSTTTVARFFAKEAPKKDAKKDDKAAAGPATAVVEEVPLIEEALKWITPTHSSLSPSERRLYEQGFEDLSATDKQLLNDFAGRLLEQPTATFYDAVLKKGALGTSQLFYTAVDPLPQGEVKAQVEGLRKQL